MDPLATAGELENHLQRQLEQDVAEQALAVASGAVRAYCKWDLARETTTFEVEGDGSTVLTLPTMQLHAVDEVRVNGTELDLTDPTLLSWSRKGQLYRPAGWRAFDLIEVDCEHGYDPIPDLIKLVTLDIAARVINNPEALVSATVGPVTRTYTSGGAGTRLSALHERLLDRYVI